MKLSKQRYSQPPKLNLLKVTNGEAEQLMLHLQHQKEKTMQIGKQDNLLVRKNSENLTGNNRKDRNDSQYSSQKENVTILQNEAKPLFTNTQIISSHFMSHHLDLNEEYKQDRERNTKEKKLSSILNSNTKQRTDDIPKLMEEQYALNQRGMQENKEITQLLNFNIKQRMSELQTKQLKHQMNELSYQNLGVSHSFHNNSNVIPQNKSKQISFGQILQKRSSEINQRDRQINLLNNATCLSELQTQNKCFIQTNNQNATSQITSFGLNNPSQSIQNNQSSASKNIARFNDIIKQEEENSRISSSSSLHTSSQNNFKNVDKFSKVLEREKSLNLNGISNNCQGKDINSNRPQAISICLDNSERLSQLNSSNQNCRLQVPSLQEILYKKEIEKNLSEIQPNSKQMCKQVSSTSLHDFCSQRLEKEVPSFIKSLQQQNMQIKLKQPETFLFTSIINKMESKTKQFLIETESEKNYPQVNMTPLKNTTFSDQELNSQKYSSPSSSSFIQSGKKKSVRFVEIEDQRKLLSAIQQERQMKSKEKVKLIIEEKIHDWINSLSPLKQMKTNQRKSNSSHNKAEPVSVFWKPDKKINEGNLKQVKY